MQTLIPNHTAWTEGIGGPKAKYMSVVDKLAKSTEFLYALQKTLLQSLLINNDGGTLTPSTRKLFLAKLRRYIMDLCMEQRVFLFNDLCFLFSKFSILFVAVSFIFLYAIEYFIPAWKHRGLSIHLHFDWYL